jgi:SAM-dependent methyltransferase
MRNVLNRQGNHTQISPVLYHAHHLRHSEDLPFWLALARVKRTALLELGCGTGRVLLHLANAGLDVFGLDLDLHMLAYLQSQVALDRRPQIKIFQADFTRFHLARRFDLIILPCNTLSTLVTDLRLALFRCVYDQLSDDGLFAASLPNPILLRRMPRVGEEEVEDTFLHPLDNEPVQVSSAWVRDALYFNLTWAYDHLLAGGQVERTQVHVKHSLEPAAAYLQDLTDAGFPFVLSFGDYDGSLYRSRSAQLILIASKKVVAPDLPVREE